MPKIIYWRVAMEFELPWLAELSTSYWCSVSVTASVCALCRHGATSEQLFRKSAKKCLVEKMFGSAGAGIQCARVTPNQLYPSCVCPYDVTEARRRRKILRISCGFGCSKVIFLKEIRRFRALNPQNFPPAAGTNPHSIKKIWKIFQKLTLNGVKISKKN